MNKLISTALFTLLGLSLAAPASTSKKFSTPLSSKPTAQQAPINVYKDIAMQAAQKKEIQDAAQKYSRAKCIGGYKGLVSAQPVNAAQMKATVQLAKLQIQKDATQKIDASMGEIPNGYWYYYNAANPGYLFSLSQLKNGKAYQYFCQLQK